MIIFVTGLWPTPDHNGFDALARRSPTPSVILPYDGGVFEAIRDNPGCTVIAHSWGNEPVAKAINALPDYQVHQLIGLDPVHYDWLYNPFAWFSDFVVNKKVTVPIVCLQKSFGLPPAVGYRGVTSTKIPTWDHGNFPKNPAVVSAIFARACRLP